MQGIWKANLEKSRRDANHEFENLTMEFQVSGDEMTLRYSGTSMSGKLEEATVTFHADGRERPASEQTPDMVTVTRWLSPRALEIVTLKDGERIGSGAYEVSTDGETMTATLAASACSGACASASSRRDRTPPSCARG